MDHLVHQTTKQRGDAGEEIAARHLLAHGLGLLGRNFRVKGGEIDLICRDGATIVFVEVRRRARTDYGGAAWSITPAKQRRLVLAARHWLVRHGQYDKVACRFDCVLINGNNGSENDGGEQLEWIRNAFDAG